VDLHAPRSRYMGETAIELLRLTFMPIPFLELLDGAQPQGPTLEPATESTLVRDRMVHRALAIRRAVSSGSLAGVDPWSASFLLLVDMSRERCVDAGAQHAWKSAVRHLSDYTAAYLNPTELEEIWNRIRSSPCYRDIAGEHKTWADLFAAISQRNAPQIAKLGSELLEPHVFIAEDDLAYLTTVTAAAYVRMAEIAQARGLLQAQWNRFDHAGPFDLPLRELVALTQPAGAAALAQTAP
jgi:hypothetical protein